MHSFHNDVMITGTLFMIVNYFPSLPPSLSSLSSLPPSPTSPPSLPDSPLSLPPSVSASLPPPSLPDSSLSLPPFLSASFPPPSLPHSLPPSLSPSLPANSEEVEALRAVVQDLEVQIEEQKLKIQNTTNALLRVSCHYTASCYPPSLLPRPSYHPVFDHLQYAKTEEEGVAYFIS